MVDIPREHKEYLSKKDYHLGTGTVAFQPDEAEKLERYGHWMEALASGTIEPFTREQERFVKVALGEMPPESEFEHLWLRLKELNEWEKEKKKAEAELRGMSVIIPARNKWAGR